MEKMGITMNNITMVGIAGGTGSGKTTFAQAVAEQLEDKATLIAHDNYYRAHDDLIYDQRVVLNYDHPDAYETSLLIKHLIDLKQGKSVEIPTYDFALHNRAARTITIHPSPVIIVEGILILADERLRDLLDIKVFVDVEADVRILRRLARDVDERGRSVQSVIDQYFATVKPMHEAFVEPSKRFADFIVPANGSNTVAQKLLVSYLQHQG
jgi:uridine kinase